MRVAVRSLSFYLLTIKEKLLKKMEQKKNKTNEDFGDKIEQLRSELIGAILQVLADNNLKEFKLSNKESDHIYVIWFDGCGYPYECTVKKVVVNGDNILLIAHHDEIENEIEINSYYELGARNLDWLCEIYEIIIATINENKK